MRYAVTVWFFDDAEKARADRDGAAASAAGTDATETARVEEEILKFEALYGQRAVVGGTVGGAAGGAAGGTGSGGTDGGGAGSSTTSTSSSASSGELSGVVRAGADALERGAPSGCSGDSDDALPAAPPAPPPAARVSAAAAAACTDFDELD